MSVLTRHAAPFQERREQQTARHPALARPATHRADRAGQGLEQARGMLHAVRHLVEVKEGK